MSKQLIDTEKQRSASLLPRGSLQRQALVDKGLNGFYRISAVAGALVFLLSSSILLLVTWVKLQQIAGRTIRIRRES